MLIRDRIKELRRVEAKTLLPNPKNWRTHPKEQQDALRGILAEVGFAGASIARELPDGSLMLIDGHLRVDTAGDSVIPVLVLDVTEEEADKLLATFDPIGAMAAIDSAALGSLLENMSLKNQSLAAMLENLANEASLQAIDEMADAIEPQPDEQDNTELLATTQFAFPVTADQELIIRAAVSKAKLDHNLITTAEAVVILAKAYDGKD